MDKPWYKSLTMVFGSVFAGLQFLEQQAEVPAGTGQAVLDFVQATAGVLALFGLRRAVSP